MFIFDQLKKSDPALKVLTLILVAGLFTLLAGLWWVQIVNARDYQAHLETQSFRTVRIPAVRGKILDRNGVVLADNKPAYNLCLYLDELTRPMDSVYLQSVSKLRRERQQQMAAEERRLGRKLKRDEKRKFTIKPAERTALKRDARYAVSSNLVASVAARVQLPLTLDREKFRKHYETRLALPYPVHRNLTPVQVARFQELTTDRTGVDLEIQSTRDYPHGSMAAHILGCLKRDDSSVEGEEAFFSYWMPDYKGVLGIEAGYDSDLRGKAGGKSVLVNNIGYRQTENVWRAAEPGKNVRLTLDAAIQQASEAALPVMGPSTRGAVVVLDVNKGDILAMVSSPAPNPNHFVQGFPTGELQRLRDPKLRPQINRATQENYAPGSIFKIVSGLAALEAGLDPNALYTVHPDPMRPSKGCFYVGGRKIRDEAEPGLYDFRRALIRSSNAYFIDHGIAAGMDRIIRLARQLHLGERASLPTRQETPGIFPTMERVRAGWSDGDTANICMGQGSMSVTPLQMAIMTAAIANGGKVLWPRLVRSVEPASQFSPDPVEDTEPGRVRSVLNVRPQNLAILRAAMLADVEDPHGTGRAAALPGIRISGKTGTAQVTDARGNLVDHTTWFVSFAPFEAPRYAVVVMVESGGSGGGTCAPIARKIYQAILERDGKIPNSPLAAQSFDAQPLTEEQPPA
jgi:penicillin-binding protein 2